MILFFELKSKDDIINLTMKLKIKKLNKNAKMPNFAHKTDAGMDLYTTEKIILKPNQKTAAPTGIAMQIPEGYVGLVWDKSGIGIMRGVKTLGGVIDAGYRGEVLVGLINLSDEKQIFKAGDKVAQILIQKIEEPEIKEVTELEKADRGEKGFGSTGKN